MQSDLQFRELLSRPVWRLEAGGWEVKGEASGMPRLLPQGREKAHIGGRINKNLVVMNVCDKGEVESRMNQLHGVFAFQRNTSNRSNISWYLLCISYRGGWVLSILHARLHLILTAILGDSYHFITDEETGSERLDNLPKVTQQTKS